MPSPTLAWAHASVGDDPRPERAIKLHVASVLYILNLMLEFRWNDWNLDHATRHGVSPEEAEAVVEATRPPFPEQIGDDKILVMGRGKGGRFVQVIYGLDEDGSLYVIHAMPLTDRQKKQLRRRLK